MQHIDITEKIVEFYNHLAEPDIDRSIFSSKYGDEKTVFLLMLV